MQYWSLVPWIKAESQDFSCTFIVSLQIKCAGIQSQTKAFTSNLYKINTEHMYSWIALHISKA